MQTPRMCVEYTNGVIAAREKYLLKEKIFRLCELSAEEAFRMLLESGYGGGAEAATSVYDYEKLIAVEEERLDAFIREYAPTAAISTYLLSPRDFHNAKALVKASYLGESASRMLAPEGLVPVDTLTSCVENGDFKPLGAYSEELQAACEKATDVLKEEPSGAKVGDAFEKALYAHLRKSVKSNRALRAILTAKADMTNILTALRAREEKIASEKYLPGGKLTEEQLSVLFDGDKEKVVKAFARTSYAEFVKTCFADAENGSPLTRAEKTAQGYGVEYFTGRKYALERTEPFLYYVFRRKAENANVRIVFVCLLAGLSESEIKKRLRTL